MQLLQDTDDDELRWAAIVGLHGWLGPVPSALLRRVAWIGRKARKEWATLWLGVFADVELTLETFLTLQEEQSRNRS